MPRRSWRWARRRGKLFSCRMAERIGFQLLALRSAGTVKGFVSRFFRVHRHRQADIGGIQLVTSGASELQVCR